MSLGLKSVEDVMTMVAMPLKLPSNQPKNTSLGWCQPRYILEKPTMPMNRPKTTVSHGILQRNVSGKAQPTISVVWPDGRECWAPYWSKARTRHLGRGGVGLWLI